MVRYLGLDWFAFRVSYAARTRLGVFRRRAPANSWSEIPLSALVRVGIPAEPDQFRQAHRASGARFFFDNALQLRSALGDFSFPEIADEILHGRLPYFDGSAFQAGIPPDWHRNPQSGHRMSASLHWSEIDEYGGGDIKMIWEPSRFLFTYALVRAFARTGDDTYAEAFWSCVEDWRERNPPNAGPNWRCGQETSLRVFAWCFGLFGFSSSPITTNERFNTLVEMIGISGRRIEANIDYALRQKNNHGISEAAALFTIGILFPVLKEAERWRETGWRLLEQEVTELFYEDGSFSQQSTNYERMALHAVIWAMRLGELNRVPLSKRVDDRVSRAAQFLYELQDDQTGRLPHYGHNDGALILPLTNCEARDYRPAIGCAVYAGERKKIYDRGPWDEELLWLFGEEALVAPRESSPRQSWRGDAGGYYTLRSDESFAFVRAPKFRHRPGQADLLHTDIWWRGVNVAMDGGTFSYNSPDAVADWLAGTRSHNTISMDGCDQMSRVSRFLWLPWPQSGITHDLTSGRLALLEIFHDGYRSLDIQARHRRAVLRIGDEWLIIDRIEGRTEHEFTVHWLLPDLPHSWDPATSTVMLQSRSGNYFVRLLGKESGTLVRGSDASPRGWYAPSYSVKSKALSLVGAVRGSRAEFVTLFSAKSADGEWNGNRVIGGDWEVSLAHQDLIRHVRCGADFLALDHGSRTS